MKKLLFVLSVLAVVLSLSSIGFAQGASTATASGNAANATIVAAIGISNTHSLDFGVVVRSVAGGTVLLTPAGSPTFDGVYTAPAHSTRSAAAFSVTGEPNYAYDVNVPPGSITLNDVAEENTMTVSNFSNDSEGQLNGSGADVFHVGGKLNVGPAQVRGDYTGTFSVTVTYQ